MPDPNFLTLNARGAEVQELQANLRKLGYVIPQHELDEQVFGVGTQDALLQLQTEYEIAPTGVLDDASRVPLASAVAEAETVGHRVEGRIFFDSGLPAEGIALRLYSRGFGGAETQLGETETEEQGFYMLPYNPGGEAANIEVRAVDAGGREVSLSATKFDADKREVMNLVAPASVRPLAPEYERLTADLSEQLGGLERLTRARESGESRDLTLLHRATGWDARLIALAVKAIEVGSDTGIPQDALYALFRAGLPTDKQRLASVSVEAVGKALEKAKATGIVSLSNRQVAAAKRDFEKFARESRLEATAPGALSSFGELLDKSGLESERDENGNEVGEKGVFENLFFTHRGSGADLWQKARDEGISDRKVDALRLQGKLAHLTLNNANLTESLQAEVRSPENLARLVEMGLYRREEWETRLEEIADSNGRSLEDLIPPAYSGEGRLDAYAADLARKVRLSFPTQVVGQMVANNELDLGDDYNAVKEPVHTFLQNAGGLGFELGRTPLNSFIRQEDAQDELFKDITQEQKKATIQSVQKLQRLYQITPSDEALKVLLNEGFDSAQGVVAFSEEGFLDHYGDAFESREVARLVHQKAKQVSAVAYNFYTAAKQLDSAPPVYAISPPAEVRENAKNELIKHYPTMESLFGSLDFCECEHCRSVLSPAAYLVDLLQFLDPEEKVWEAFLKGWKDKHTDLPYPLKDQSEWERFLKDWKDDHPNQPDADAREDAEERSKLLKPYDILTKRRPDLEHLPLTCENTHTALPYIDVVNEILEYYVAENNLEEYEGHDTGSATTPELLAEPQNILPEAYDVLKQARYPLGLPFDLWLETVRRFFDHFETPLWQVMEILCPTDDLFAPSPNPNAEAYYRAEIFAEYLGISPDEYDVFTNPDPLATWHELYGYADGDEAREALKSAKTLSRRLGVTYRELLDLVRTGFVNPQLETLVFLRKLGVDVDDVFRYKTPLDPNLSQKEKYKREQENKAFEERLDELTKKFNPSLDQSGFDAEKWLDEAWNNEFDKILLLADPDAGCNFDQTTLRYANGDDTEALDLPLDLLKINLFVRLWRKLGWTMEETDRALQTFIPKNSRPLTGMNFGAAMKTALLYLAHLKALDERAKAGKAGRLKLLALWSDLDTTGKNPLYAQLFLTRSVLKDDAVFDHPLGQYLSYFDAAAGQYKPFRWISTQPEDVKTGNVPLKSHLVALQGALGLTADDIKQILADAEKDLDDEPLTLANISLLYRYGLLAKALKLSVRDLISLKELSGLDPFQQLKEYPRNDDPVAALDADHPFTQTLHFVEVVEEVRESDLRIEDLEYLLRHRFDPVGKYRPNPAVLPTLVGSLSAGIRRIETEHAVPADAAAITDDLFREKLGLVLPADVVEESLGFLNDTIAFSAVKEDVPGSERLDPAKYEVGGVRVAYDATRERQQVLHTGVLTQAKKASILGKVPAPGASAPQDEKDAHANFTELLNTIAAESQPRPKEFLEKHFEGFLTYDDLYEPTAASLSVEQKRKKILEKFLPFVQRKLTRQLVVQASVADLGGNPSLVEALLTDARLLSAPPPGQPGQKKPLLDTLTTVTRRGVTAEFFSSSDLSGAPADTVEETATADLTDAPSGTNSARFRGYLEVPVAGAYRFYAVLGKKDAEAELHFAHLTDPLLRGSAAADGAEISEFVELKPGVMYDFTLEVHNLQGGSFALLAKGKTTPKDALGQLTLYPHAIMGLVNRARTLLAKTLQLVEGLGLSEREVRHMLTHAADFDDLDLSKLPTREADDSPTGAQALFEQFLHLAGYARLKRELAGGTDDLVGIFENARRSQLASADVNELCQRLANLTRRDMAAIQATAEHLGFIKQDDSTGELQVPEPTNFAQEKGLQRLWEALRVVEKLGVPVDAIARWATPKPDFAIARDLRNTVKARYEPDNWQRIAQAIFDRLRQRQRDALVAHIMHQEKFERVEQLFEYFLIDPGMEPVVQTSRLRLAISSVQLFIQRCLLNLEPKVHPSAIDSRRWQWMKRYRVWEANRKIFLFPENWLEPEFRDDKTNLFQELESALLQGDVSNGLAEDAFLNYLKKLEELARLDIVAMYCEEKLLDPASNTLHVIGRTYSLPHKYFYRRYSHQMWTPWEPVTAKIEGDHLVAVVWRERLHLFWLTFLEKGKQKKHKTDGTEYRVEEVAGLTASEAVQKEVEIQLNWSEYFEGQWTTRESSGFGNPILALVTNHWHSSWVSIHVSFDDKEKHVVKINLSSGHVNAAFRVVSKNSHPEVVADDLPQQVPYSGRRPALEVEFVEKIEAIDGEEKHLRVEKTILEKGGGFFEEGYEHFSLLISNKPAHVPDEIGPLISPFFYEDNQNTFFVEPSLTEITTREWEDYVIDVSPPHTQLEKDDYWARFPIQVEVPEVRERLPIGPSDPLSRFKVQLEDDWVTNPTTMLRFDERLIGQGGGLDFMVLPAGTDAGDLGISVNVSRASDLTVDGVLVVSGHELGLDGDTFSGIELDVIGGGGLNPALARNRDALRAPGTASGGGFVIP